MSARIPLARPSAHAALLSLLMAIVAGLGSATPAAAQNGLSAQRLAWTRLEFQAKKLGITGTSSVELSRTPISQVPWELEDPPARAAKRGAREPLVVLTLESKALGKASGERVWVHPATGASLQSTSWSSGSFKAHRFGDDSVLFERRNPAGEVEQGQPPSAWTDRWSHRYPVPTPGLVVTDPSALLYWVAAAPLNKVGDETRMLAFHRDGSSEVRMRVVESTRIPVRYERSQGSEVTTRREDVRVLVISMTSRPLEAGQRNGTRFLGLKGNVEIFLDPKLRMPVKVSGQSTFGGVDVLLRRAFVNPAG